MTPKATTTAPLTPVPTRIPQRRLARELPDAYAALDAQLRSLVEPLSPAARTTAPPWGGWSVDQILEHLCISNEAYLRSLRPIVDDVVARGRDPDDAVAEEPWRPTLAGRMLAWSLQRPAKLPAPGPSRPGDAVRADVLGAVLASHAEVLAAARTLAAESWRSLRLASPLASMIRLNVGDVLLVLLAHGRRHAGQIARTAAAVA